jgi:hypothetical protein
MARKISNSPGRTSAAPHRLALTCKNVAGAGDENRTRTISLGSSAVTAARDADLVTVAVPSDRGCPLVTLVNSPLMARRSWADAALFRAFLRPARPSSPASEQALACTKRQVASTILGHFAELYVRHRYYGASADRKHMAQAPAAHSVVRCAGEVQCSLP